MKNPILQLIAWCLLTGMVQAQVTPTSLSVSYVLEQTPRTAQTSVSGSSPYADVPATVSYFDGLGRPLQTVQVRAAGNAGSDIISGATIYDAFGRPQKTYLPLPVPTNKGQIALSLQTPAAAFYTNDQNPYAETVYENSPLARLTQQFGPGQAWRAGGGKPQSFTYGVATGVIRFKVNGLYDGAIYANPDNVTTQREYFGATEITCLKTRTEQGNTRIQYTDLQGRMIRNDVVLSSGQILTTAYIYDNYERLTAVIPPKLYQWFLAGPPDRTLKFFSNEQDVALFKETAYVYLHDKRGRVISKHIPGAGWTTLIYDRQDRLVMSQDQQDKASNQWRFTKYDGLDRPIMTGRISLTLTAQALDDLRVAFADRPISSEERSPAGGNLLGYTTGSFPGTVPISEANLLTVNYYDTNPSSITLDYQSTGAFGTALASTIGQLTSNKVRNLETQVWYDSQVWYDFKGRVIQAQSQNHLGGTDRTDTDYRFNGEVNQTVLRHQKGSGGPTMTIATSYTYDHMGRSTQVSHAVDTAPPTILATYAYDAIGRMQTKILGGTASAAGVGSVQNGLWTQGTTWQGGNVPGPMSSVSINAGHTITIPANNTVGAGKLYDASQLVFELGSILRLNGGTGGGSTGAFPQTLDYTWHLRGSLRGLNLNAGGTPDLTGGKTFAMKLGYDDAGYYDGNIGSQTWLHSRDGLSRSYTYAYDQASRLTTATYGGGAGGENFTVNGMSYDANGNILNLNRNGADQLSYRYDDANESNKLLAVTDAISNTVGFTDGTNTGDDYDYWPDGSLKKDLNRGVTDIQYNLLKLPQQLTFSSGKVVSYQYDANGKKLKMSVTGTGSETRDYLGPFQYLNNALFEIGHEEGRYTPTGGYEYFHKDHLGNVRVAFNASGITQYTDYDPWGLPLWGNLSGGNSTNRDKFNGKESLSELGVGVSDYGARLQDATIGRWFVVDPLAEVSRRFSPYAYVYNNPLRFIDPDGMNGIEPRPDFNYSDGYSSGSADNSSSVGRGSFSGTFATVGGGGGSTAGSASGPCPPNCANRMQQATVQTYKPDMLDQWKESESLIGKITYGMADGLYAVGQIVTLQGVQTHLGGQGFDNANDALQTTMGGLATVAGPLLGAFGKMAKGTEYFYRSMSNAEYAALESSRGLSSMAGKELFISTSAEYSRSYLGRAGYDVLVKFGTNKGTLSDLSSIGVRNGSNAVTSLGFGNLPKVGRGWMQNGSNLFKGERGILNVGLGSNPSVFNRNISSFKAIK